MEEAEKATWVVCCRWTVPAYFDDDLKGSCTACGHAIRFRPTAPRTPPKICMQCAAGVAAAH